MNDSLIIDPQTDPMTQEIELAKVRDEILLLCNNVALWSGQIADGVHNIACRYDTVLDDKAEYWLLQALGSEIAYPKVSFWRRVAALHNRANKCSDATFERARGLFNDYADLRIQLLERRAGLSGGRIDEALRRQYEQAVMRAKDTPRL